MAKILLVDDTEEIRDLIKIILEGIGHDVTPCSNGEKALEILERNNFDLMLSDYVMPGITGLELISKVHKKYPEVATIIMSSTLRRNDELPCPILRKPNDIKISIIDNAINTALKR